MGVARMKAASSSKGAPLAKPARAAKTVSVATTATAAKSAPAAKSVSAGKPAPAASAVRLATAAQPARGAVRAEFLPFHRPLVDDDDVAGVVATLRSGWLTTGPTTKRFEEAFAQALGVRAAIAVNSGTAAMHLALRVLGIQPGDDVVVPAYTFTATAEVVTYLGARPLLADVDPVTCNLRADDVARVLTPRTRAVMPVHIAGLPCEMTAIRELASGAGIAVVEDAAHAFPAREGRRPVGTLGDAAAFSFYATKNLTTGEGGMLVLRDAALEEHARVLALHGMSRDAWRRYSATGQWRYDVLANGLKINLTDVAASLGLTQLAKQRAFLATRRRLAARYGRKLAAVDAVETPPTRDGVEHAWHLYMIRLRPEMLRIDRDAFIEELRARNIGTSVHFIPLHLHTYYQHVWGYRPGDFPNAESIFARVVSLPLYPAMTPADVDDVVAAVADVVRRHRR
jgi:dTDP-4-amino-4,6-dideoxygalactose transaminase